MGTLVKNGCTMKFASMNTYHVSNENYKRNFPPLISSLPKGDGTDDETLARVTETAEDERLVAKNVGDVGEPI